MWSTRWSACSIHPAAIGQVFNLGSDEEISMNDLADRVIQLSGSKSTIEHISYEEAYGQKFDDMARRVPRWRRSGRSFRSPQDLSWMTSLNQ